MGGFESRQAPTNVVVAGATGLVGRELVRLLAARAGTAVTALVRSAGASLGDGVHEVVFDYEARSSYAAIGDRFACDVVFCCLGTTRAIAGSDDAFRRVDRDYPRALIDRCAALKALPVFGLVSSVGADRPRGLYLRTKAEAEAALRASGLRYVIARPSLLLGERHEVRLGERVGAALGTPIARAAAVVFGRPVERYVPIRAAQVAAALVWYAVERRGGPDMVVEGRAFYDGVAAG